MGDAFSGGGGDAPKAPKLKMIDTSVGGDLWNAAANAGDTWAQHMRQDYGFEPGGPAWRAPLGKGALAMMTQAELPFAGKEDPQIHALEKTAGMGDIKLGSNPYEVSRNLGQQTRAPYGQANRNESFLGSMLNQWKPPDLRLTGEDMLNVAMGNATNMGQAQQQAFQSALLGQSAAQRSADLANASIMQSFGNFGAAGIKAAFSPSLYSGGYYSPFAGGAMPETADTFASGDMGGGISGGS